jgi:hypothetical protein
MQFSLLKPLMCSSERICVIMVTPNLSKITIIGLSRLLFIYFIFNKSFDLYFFFN